VTLSAHALANSLNIENSIGIALSVARPSSIEVGAEAQFPILFI
jgi:hypothetical protein